MMNQDTGLMVLEKYNATQGHPGPRLVLQYTGPEQLGLQCVTPIKKTGILFEASVSYRGS
jgi:hypothetical protein